MCTLPSLQLYDFKEILELEKKHNKKVKAEAVQLFVAEPTTILLENKQ
jgi:hypothetical protein